MHEFCRLCAISVDSLKYWVYEVQVESGEVKQPNRNEAEPLVAVAVGEAGEAKPSSVRILIGEELTVEPDPAALGENELTRVLKAAAAL